MGLTLGLVYAWLIEPVELVNTTPDMLRSDYQHEWIRLAALAYVTDGDLQRIQLRLETLPQAEIQEALAALIEAYARQGRPAETMRALSNLASQLGVHTPAMEVYLGAEPPAPTPIPPPTPPPEPSPTPIPSSTDPMVTPKPLPPTPPPTAVFPSPHRVLSQTMICEGPTAQLQVVVWAAPEQAEEGDEAEEAEPETEPPTPLPGVVLWLTWPGGADRAVTGLRPQIDPGYADFTLHPDTVYALSVGEPNAPVVSGITIPACPAAAGQEPGAGSWQVVVEIAERE